jgi:hypothetical protein
VKIIDKEMTGLGQGAQIGKSCSRTLEAARHEIKTFIQVIDAEMVRI